MPPLPPPLPPETRTVGQLVAETLRLYARRFWISLPLGLSVAIIDQLLFGVTRLEWLLVMMSGGALLLTASYVGAAAIEADVRPTPRTAATALAAGVIVFAPVPFLMLGFVLPAIAWLALLGLAVPAAVREELSLPAALRRGVQLARADYVHALGSLATLAITYFLTRLVLVYFLQGTGDQTERVAVFLGDVVISPLLFLGAAMLYADQEARLKELRPRERGGADAEVPDADDAERAGPEHAAREPGAPA
jgi:hypothetical protein